MRKDKLDRVNEIMEELVKDGEIAGMNLLITRFGKEQHYYEVGKADIAAKKPIKRDTIFRLYSMTKPVTAAAVMMLFEDGKIDLVDPVEKYLPGFQNQHLYVNGKKTALNAPMQIHHLLSMTSGLTYGGEDENGKETWALLEELQNKLYSETPVTTLEFANRLGGCALAFAPGEHFAYGFSADVLGAIVEVVSGMSFGSFLKKRLFWPLGMKDTDFYVPKEKKDRLSRVYEKTEEGLKEFRLNNLGILNKMDIKPAFESGGAGLVSTIDDYAKFGQMLLQGGIYKGQKILSNKTVEYMTTGRLYGTPRADFSTWDGLQGFEYRNLMRIARDKEAFTFNASVGEYGWDGWLGAYFANLPKEDATILFMMQRTDTGTAPFTRRLRNVIAAAFEEF